jgi:signal transduction histidine kinase
MNAEALYQIYKSLEDQLELPPLFAAILELLPRFGADFGSLLIQETNDQLHYLSSIPGREGMVGPAGRRFAYRLLTDGLSGQVLRRNKAEVIEDLSTDPRAYQPDYLLNSCRGAVLIPMQMPKAEAKGTLLFGSKKAGAFTIADLADLEMIVWQISQSIENTLLYRNQAERSTQLALINEVSRAATSILNVKLMLATVTQAIQRSFGFYRVSIYRVIQDENPLRLDAYTRADGRTIQPEENIQPHGQLINWVAEHRQTVFINDVQLDNRYTPKQHNEQVKSNLVIPIRLGIKTIGVLELESSSLDAFSPLLVSALETLTDQLAIAIENARLYDEVSDRVNELLSLNRISQAVPSSLDLHQTLTLITEQVNIMLNVAATSVALRDDKTNEVWFAAAFGDGAPQVLGLRIPLGTGIAGWVAENGVPITVPDVRTDPRFLDEVDKQSGFITKSILCVPLESKGRLIGAIEAMNKLDGSKFSARDIQQLTALTAPAATAIENAQLYQELEQKIAQLEHAQEQLIQSAKLGAIGELAAGVAHEINNPLTSIIGLSRVLYDDFREDEEVREDLRIIQEEANRAKTIVRALLDFARVGTPVRTTADLNTIFEEAIFLALPESSHHRIKVNRNLAPMPLISVDENQIKQVIINILNNAAQAMPNGGELSIASRLMMGDTTMVGLSISDTGGGIPIEFEDKIFDPFFTTKEPGQGTGLGLSVSYGIIERHSGRIEVENEPGVGTTFHLMLPVEQIQVVEP